MTRVLNLVTLQCVTVKVLSILLVTFSRFALCRRSLRTCLSDASAFRSMYFARSGGKLVLRKNTCSLFTTSLRIKRGVICAVKTFCSRVIDPEKSNL